MENSKKVFVLKNKSGETVSVVRIKSDLSGARVTIAFGDKKFAGAKYVVSDGVNFCYVENGDFLQNVDLFGDVKCAAIIDGDVEAAFPDLISVKHFFEKSGFAGENGISESIKSRLIYDDEALAEENYYQAVNEYETEIIDDENAEKQFVEIGKDKSQKTCAYTDEANACDCKKSVNKPENATYCGERSDLLSEKDEVVLFGEEYEFRKIVAKRERTNDLYLAIPNSEFYVMDGQKPYYLGAVKIGKTIGYFVYAVAAKRGFPPKGFENGYYVPRDLFCTSSGYYCLFQKAEGFKSAEINSVDAT